MIERVPLSEEVYTRLRVRIFNKTYRPGQRMDPLDIATGLGVSRQPVKDALNRLAVEGLVVIKPRVGTFVRVLTRQDVKEIMQVRLMIESFALGSIKTFPSDSLRILKQTVALMDQILRDEPFDYLRYNESDIVFHRTLVDALGNATLTRTYHRLHPHYVTAWTFFDNSLVKTWENHDEHRAMYLALAKGDLTSARSLAEQHILDALGRLLDQFPEEDNEQEDS